MVGVPNLLFKYVLRMICKDREYLISFALTFEHAQFSSSFLCSLIRVKLQLVFFDMCIKIKKNNKKQNNQK